MLTKSTIYIIIFLSIYSRKMLVNGHNEDLELSNSCDKVGIIFGNLMYCKFTTLLTKAWQSAVMPKVRHTATFVIFEIQGTK